MMLDVRHAVVNENTEALLKRGGAQVYTCMPWNSKNSVVDVQSSWSSAGKGTIIILRYAICFSLQNFEHSNKALRDNLSCALLFGKLFISLLQLRDLFCNARFQCLSDFLAVLGEHLRCKLCNIGWLHNKSI